jgi:soluble lytic murein transglycosylase
MRSTLLAALPALLCLTIAAHAQDVASAMRADHWDEALEYASAYPDPVARKLVTYYRLLAPNVGNTSDLIDFIASSPDWPQQELLARRRDEALAREADDATAAALCVKAPPTLAPALQRCATAFAQAGQVNAATDTARLAWINLPGNAIAESSFTQRWSSVLRGEDQYRRFDTLAWTDAASAARQIARLDASQKAMAEARLALRRDDPNALTLVAALSPAQRGDPGVFLEHARYLRRANREGEAVALWTSEGYGSESRAPAPHLAAFWAERNLLARRHLRLNDPPGAYALAAGHAQRASEQVAEAEFLAGFIALRFLKDPSRASMHFRTVANVSKAAITQSRAHYWLARAAAARGDSSTEQSERAAAAAFPTTYYGQLAVLGDARDTKTLHASVTALRDPAWTDPQALDFAGRELTRAATMLITWGEKRRAYGFLLRLEDLAPDDAHRALVGQFATGLGLPDLAVAVARRAGREGVMLPQTGWPIPVTVPDGPVAPAATLGVIRQESSFDTGVVSPVGARGLMQLMPATAAGLAKKIGQTPTLQSLTGDPSLNILLGTTYLRGLLDQFGDQLPLAIAAYNAGPSRVSEWLAANGDPRSGQVDMVDWIELIPFDETRNYVERVSENVVMYSVRRNDSAPLAMAEWQTH